MSLQANGGYYNGIWELDKMNGQGYFGTVQASTPSSPKKFQFYKTIFENGEAQSMDQSLTQEEKETQLLNYTELENQ